MRHIAHCHSRADGNPLANTCRQYWQRLPLQTRIKRIEFGPVAKSPLPAHLSRRLPAGFERLLYLLFWGKIVRPWEGSVQVGGRDLRGIR